MAAQASANVSADARFTVPACTLVPATVALLPQIAEMERLSYPADEMCTPENFAYRQAHAQPFFKVAVVAPEADASSSSGSDSSSSASPRVLGFVVGTLSASSKLDHDSMFAHAAHGAYLCIHSVVVDPALRRRGLARAMLLEYVAQIKRANLTSGGGGGGGGAVKAIVLIAKQDLVPFYTSCGFALQGKSDVVHGADEWFECRMQLDEAAAADKSAAASAAVDAVQA